MRQSLPRLVSCVLFFAILAAPLTAAEKSYKDDGGRLRVRPAPADPKFNNPWPKEWEEGLADRSNHALKYWSTQKLGFNSWGENEKAGYPQMMWAYVRMLYNVGMMEWDSENYHGHTLAPYHNLYDFAKDPEVKRLAKAALDWLYAAGAAKYWRGGFGGPNNRDYGGGNVVFGGGAVQPLWLYFGDAVIENPGGHYDDVHHITSGYRPPAAVIELACQNFERPVELHTTKPDYELWDPDEQPDAEVQPRYWETIFYGQTYQLGSARSKEPMQPWTPSIFKMLAYNSNRGVDYFVVNTSKLGGHSAKNPGDQIAQFRNLLIWLRPASSEPKTFYFQLPKTAKHEKLGDIWFARLEKTYLAIRPIQLAEFTDYEFPKYTDKIDKKTGKPKPNSRAVLYQNEQFFKAEVRGRSFAGFALEVGEDASHGNYDKFKQAVAKQGQLVKDELDNGVVTLVGSDARRLTLRHNPENDLPIVERDGEPWDYQAHLDVYRPVDQTGPISQGWLSGTLSVEAGGRKFSCTVTRDGKVTWENSPTD